MRGVKEAGTPFVHDEAIEAKLFQSGGSQAVRLPKAFRFEGDRVRIRRDGDAVILEPFPMKRKFKTEQEVLDWLETIRIPDFPDRLPQDSIDDMSPIMREWLDEAEN